MSQRTLITVFLQITFACAIFAPCVQADETEKLNQEAASSVNHVVSLSAALPEAEASINEQPTTSIAPNAVTSAQATEVLNLTNEVLFKEIDLERYYLQYRMRGSQEPKYRRLRFFLLQQTAGSAFLASNIINTVETARHLKTPDEVSGKAFKGSASIGITGCVLGATSSSIEMWSNGYLALKNKWTKNDPATARLNVIARLHEIDELLQRRNALVDKCQNGDVSSILRAEGDVLKTFRDWCVYEFADAYSDIKSLQTSYNVFYALDVSAYAVSLASYVLGIQSERDYRQVFSALHTAFVADSLFTVEAPASTYAYRKLYNYWWNNLAKELHQKPQDAEEQAKSQMIHLEHLAANADDSTLALVGPVASRLTVYSFWSTRYDKYINHRLGEMRRQSRIALQSQISGPLLGATGLAQDTFNAVGVHRYRNNEYKQNSLAFAGAATSTLSAAASVGLTGWWFVDQILDDRANRRDKLLPQFLLADRLQTLSVMESMLQSKEQP